VDRWDEAEVWDPADAGAMGPQCLTISITDMHRGNCCYFRSPA